MYDSFDSMHHFIINLMITDNYLRFFPIASLCIFVLFAALKMWNYRIAWFLSLSAPGIILFPTMIVDLLATPNGRRIFVLAILVSLFLLPGFWIFPIVFAVQIRNVVKSKWERMSPYSYVEAAMLLGLYFWTDFIGKMMMSPKL
jgi:hypothetical protein